MKLYWCTSEIKLHATYFFTFLTNLFVSVNTYNTHYSVLWKVISPLLWRWRVFRRCTEPKQGCRVKCGSRILEFFSHFDRDRYFALSPERNSHFINSAGFRNNLSSHVISLRTYRVVWDTFEPFLHVLVLCRWLLVNAELALLQLWASSRSLVRPGPKKTNYVSSSTRWNPVCSSEEEHGLGHLKQQRGNRTFCFSWPVRQWSLHCRRHGRRWLIWVSGTFLFTLQIHQGEKREKRLVKNQHKLLNGCWGMRNLQRAV